MKNLLAGTIHVPHADHPVSLAWCELVIAKIGQVSESTSSRSHRGLTRYHNYSPYNCGCYPTQLDWGSYPG